MYFKLDRIMKHTAVMNIMNQKVEDQGHNVNLLLHLCVVLGLITGKQNEEGSHLVHSACALYIMNDTVYHLDVFLYTYLLFTIFFITGNIIYLVGLNVKFVCFLMSLCACSC